MMFILILHNYSAKCAPLAPALFVFGDSLVDSGNNNMLPTLARADYPPYGMNFKIGLPTGRFTNGRTTVDFIAEYLGLPYSPPYKGLLRRLLHPKSVLTGLNYASAASGILPQTGKQHGECLSMEEQLDLFEKTVKHEISKYITKPEEVSNYLAKSVFVISTGNNDNDFNYLNTNNTANSNSPQSFADLLILNLSKQIQRLYGLGARKVIVFEMGPIGCIPSNAKTFKHINNGPCVEEINQFALDFNAKLQTMLHNLTTLNLDSSFVLARAYALGYDAIINPSKYGLSDTSNPCCESFSNGTLTCIPDLWALTCKDPQKHYFFDGFHPTETVCKAIATLSFNGSSICNPNIQHLVSQNN